ncbi:peptidyl-prolyl cis-trans isomerase C [Chitinivorax tropicus]|uniref:peptidylprolyl isomerase n=1 Tax=Chitinivorax tropicus TaxID=714531 RepID=A0A840MME7_9PROT|nr:peptidylprolyl isomerase [Chitinivorax tropicus]MBB5019590.1 peptidyl-prolyl cis-trans isomerase C [Chitinivorax tropicus]
MAITVNGGEITDDMIAEELLRHDDADNPLQAAVYELILRKLLLEKATELAIDADNDDERIDAVLMSQVTVPDADRDACHTWYQNHPEQFRQGELAEARHILFQITEQAPLELLRATASSVLEELKANPDRFEALAKQYSNCPSSEMGGHLGQLQRGQTVPEFDAVLFRLNTGQFAEQLVETRFGLHILQVLRRDEGRMLPFEEVESRIAQFLNDSSLRRAVNQYLNLLVGQADIQGIDIAASRTPLVQ